MMTTSPSIGLTNLAKPYHVHYHLSQPGAALRAAPQPRCKRFHAAGLMSVGTRLVLDDNEIVKALFFAVKPKTEEFKHNSYN